LYIAIRERTREIGTLRAIGMGRRWVLGMFVIETATLAFAATTIGCIVAALVIAAINAMEIQVSSAFQMFLMSDTLKLEMDLATAGISIVVIGTVTTVASLLPSWRAARKPPVTAIQHV
jgi:ABC-type lipoprotein release transport system permease subunit